MGQMAFMLVEGEATSSLASVWSEFSTALTTMTSNPLAVLAIGAPIAAGIIVAAKKIFKRG